MNNTIFDFKPIASITPRNQYWQNNTWKFNMPEIAAGSAYAPSWREVILSGVGSLTLVNAKADGLNYVKLFGKTEQSNLPNGYTRVDYLQSSGEEYIDLGGTLSTTTDDIELTLQITTLSNTMSFVGARNSTTDRNYNIGAYGTSSAWRWGWKGNSNAVPDVTIDTNKHTFYIDHTNQTLSIDGVVVETRGISGNITTPTTPILFGIHATSATLLYLTPVRIYKFKKWRNGELVQHLVPYRRLSDNELGMYDFVTGDFLTNAGDGDFVAGADVINPTPDNIMPIWCNNGMLKVSGNLLNRNDLEGGYLLTDEGQLDSANNNWILTNFIKVKPNTSYIFDFISGGDSVYRRVCGYSTNDYNSFTELLVKKQKPVTEGERFSESFTTSATTNYIKVSTYKADTNIQITEGAEAINYRAYGEIYADGTAEIITDSLSNTATAEMLLSTGNYTDTQEILTGAITRKTAIKVLKGVESWYVNTGDYNFYRLNSAVNYSGTLNAGFYCTHFKPTAVASATNNQGIRLNGNAIFLRWDDLYPATTKNLPLFKQWLADQYANGTPVILVYPITTATTESVTGQILTTQAGTNTITATGSLSDLPMEISYMAGVSVTVTQIENAQLSNNVEVTIQ